MAIVRTYKDLDLSFVPHPATEDINKKTGTLAIVQAVKNLVLLNYYEKPFHPEIGSNVRRLLFELATPATANLLSKEIKNVLSNFEPRIKLENVYVTLNDDNNSFDVTIVFFQVNVPEPITVSFYLERLR
jgi:phage baseplate assembly protein W